MVEEYSGICKYIYILYTFMLFFHLHLPNPFSIEAKLFKTTKKAKEIILKKQPLTQRRFFHVFRQGNRESEVIFKWPEVGYLLGEAKWLGQCFGGLSRPFLGAPKLGDGVCSLKNCRIFDDLAVSPTVSL